MEVDQLCFYEVVRFECWHPFRGTSQNQIPGLQGDELGDEFQQYRNAEDHLVGSTPLFFHPVNFQAQL